MTQEEIDELAGKYAEKVSFRVPYDGTNDFYDSKHHDWAFEAFKAGYAAAPAYDEKEIKLKFLWELIEDWQDAREGDDDDYINEERFSFNDIEISLYDKMELIDPKAKDSPPAAAPAYKGDEPMKIVFTDLKSLDDNIPEDKRWMADIKGVAIVTADSKEKAFDEILKSLKVLLAYNSNHQLPTPTQPNSVQEGEKEAVEGWIRVEDRLPDFNTPVFVNCKIYGRYIASYNFIGEFNGEKYGNWHDGKNLGALPPSHWMPLPAPPQQ